MIFRIPASVFPTGVLQDGAGGSSAGNRGLESWQWWFLAAVRKSLLLNQALNEVASDGVIQGNYPPVIGQF
jgi:hypothetical protein